MCKSRRDPCAHERNVLGASLTIAAGVGSPMRFTCSATRSRFSPAGGEAGTGCFSLMIRTLVCMVRCSDGRSGKICRHAILLMVVDGVAKNQSPTQKADGSPVAAAAAAAAAQTKPVCVDNWLRTSESACTHLYRHVKTCPTAI